MNYISKGYYISSFIYLIEGKLYMTKNHSKEMDSHLYKHVHDENPFERNG